MGLAQAQEDIGDRAGAESSYQQALALRPDWPMALGGLLELKRGQAPLALIETAQALQRGNGLDDAGRALLGYGLGKALDGLGRHAEAMTSWIDANAARRRMIGPLDRAALDERANRLIEDFSPRFWQRVAASGLSSTLPVFVVGMPRSGTTLVEQIIAAHPGAVGCGELPDIALMAQRLPQRLAAEQRWPAHPAAIEREVLREEAGRYLALLERKAGPGVARAVDKAPLNFFHVGLIAALFPQARVVWCRRDPRDVALSIFSENFALQAQYATDLADIGYFHRIHERLMRHWQASNALPIIEIDYARLVQDFEGTTRQLIEFLGLPWDPACLDFHASARAVQTPSRWQVRQPIYTGSLGRWRKYAAWLSPLLAELADEDASALDG